ncbi:MAG: hypothetical protein AAB328_01520, partial [candidate division NC10 bacterium]
MTRWTAVAIAAVLLGASPFPASAVPPDEAVLSLEKYSTPKGRSLGTAYHAQLRQFSEQIYHCVPWVDIRKHGLGFNKPRFATADDRYLSVWLEIDQHEETQFAALGREPAGAACIPARQIFSVRESGRTPFRQPSDLALAGDRLLVL